MGDAAAHLGFVVISAAACTDQDVGKEFRPASPFGETGMVEIEPNENHFSQAVCRANRQWSVGSGANLIEQYHSIDISKSCDFGPCPLKQVVLPRKGDSGKRLQTGSLTQYRNFAERPRHQSRPGIVFSSQLLAAAATGNDQSSTKSLPFE